MSASPPVSLTIAGSDPSGGAGIQADLKTFHALGAYGTAVVTALTAQNTQRVSGVHVVPADFVEQQLATLAEDVRIDSVKVGMLADAEIAEVVRQWFSRGPLAGVHRVLDPVMVATSGDRLLDETAVEVVRELVAVSSVITPNLGEAGLLLGADAAEDVAAMSTQAEKLRTELGAERVLLKGGHLGGDESVDVWADADGVRLVPAPRVATKNTHGTGCTLSSAIAALRPQRDDWFSAVVDAKSWLTRALEGGGRLHVGSGHGPVDHWVRRKAF